MEVQTTDYFKWKPLYIVPIGDIQLGASGINVDQLRADIKRGVDLHKAGEQVRFIGLGDYVDVDSPSGRQKRAAAGFYDSHMAALDEVAETRLGELLRYFRETHGLWLGMHHGNHYPDFGDGTITDTRLAGALGAPYLKTSALTRVRFQRAGTSSVAGDIYSWHGAGSGQTQVAPINKLEKISGFVDADLYLISHFARRSVAPRDKVYMNHQGILASKTLYMIATGGYMKAYDEGAGRIEAGYVEKAGMSAVTMGGVIIKWTPMRARETANGKRIDRLWIKQEVVV